MERNFRRPLDWSDGRKSLDSNPNRRWPLVPHLQKTGKSRGGECQEVESRFFCPDGEQVRETHGSFAEEGGDRKRSCDFNAGYRGRKRDAERLLPTDCKARGSVQGMGRHRSSLQTYCQYFHRSVCVCLHRQHLIDNTITNNWANICLKGIFMSHSRCADATPGPHRMSFFIHLHLQQPHLSHPGHGGEVVPGSWHPTVPAGSNLLLQLSFPVCPCRWADMFFLPIPASMILIVKSGSISGTGLTAVSGTISWVPLISFVPSPLLLFTRMSCYGSWIMQQYCSVTAIFPQTLMSMKQFQIHCLLTTNDLNWIIKHILTL